MTKLELEEAQNRTIFRRAKDKENPFVMIDRTIFNDEGVSWKAKGLLGYLLSKPDDWIVRMEDLIKHASDGRHATASAIRELEEHGYLTRCQEHGEHGHFAQLVIEVHEVPVSPERRTKPQKRTRRPQTGFPLTVKPQTEKPLTENQLITNTDSTDTDCTNIFPTSPQNSPSALPHPRADPLLFEQERRTVAHRAQVPNYAAPLSAGGDDSLADHLVSVFCQCQREPLAEPVGQERRTWQRAFDKILRLKRLSNDGACAEQGLRALLDPENGEFNWYSYSTPCGKKFQDDYCAVLGRIQAGGDGYDETKRWKGSKQNEARKRDLAPGAAPRRVATPEEAAPIIAAIRARNNPK